MLDLCGVPAVDRECVAVAVTDEVGMGWGIGRAQKKRASTNFWPMERVSPALRVASSLVLYVVDRPMLSGHIQGHAQGHGRVVGG